MQKQKTTKRALLMSFLSLLLCASMLVGTTFAWFTDSVTSGNNKIIAGNLDVELEYASTPDGAYSSVEGKGDLFVAPAGQTKGLWEPGHTEVAYLKVRNAGTLNLKYNLSVAPFTETVGYNEKGEEICLSEILKFFATEPSATSPAAFTRETAQAQASASDANLKTYAKNEVVLAPGASHYIAVAVYMPESVGNEANYRGTQIPTIEFGLTLLATQYTEEQDSFGKDYDKNSTYPMGKDSYVSKGYEDINFEAKVEIPSEAPLGGYELDIPKDSIQIAEVGGNVTVDFEMNLLRDGTKVENSGITWPVTLRLPHGFVDVTAILHNGKAVEGITVNRSNNTVSFTTNHFSPFKISYVDYLEDSFPLEATYNEATADYTITKGMFVGKNPVEFDPGLKNSDKYIVADFEKDEKTYYVVSERANTIFVSNDSAYAPENEVKKTITLENGTFDVTYVTKLSSFFAGLSDNDFNTVYLLPGEYVDGSTIYVKSSMDIIGLGDTNAVKVIKGPSTGSNQHLFNCAGQKEEYIQVTIRNLYLNANEPNYNGTKRRDNAAVQSIRRSKVKCYDLVVDKGSLPFYVNAANEWKKNPSEYCAAYMYVENSVLTCSSNGALMVLSFKSLTTADAEHAYFTHYGMTCKNGALQFTENRTITNSREGTCHVVNERMAANDWIWD